MATKNRKVRNIKKKPLPDGPLDPGECVLGPRTRIERYIRAKYTAFRVMLDAYGPALTNAKDISLRERGLRRGFEAMGAGYQLAATEAFYSPDKGQKYMGLKVAKCECGPGVGHNAPKDVPTRNRPGRK